MKKFPKLSLEQLANEMQLTSEKEKESVVGGVTGGYFDCFFQCLSFISGNSVSYFEDQYEAFCGYSYYDPNNPGIWYSPEVGAYNPNLLPVFYNGVSLSQEKEFASQFFNYTESFSLTSGYNQTTADAFNNTIYNGGNIIISTYNQYGEGHAMIVNSVFFSGNNNDLVFACYDPQSHQSVIMDSNSALSYGNYIANFLVTQ